MATTVDESTTNSRQLATLDGALVDAISDDLSKSNVRNNFNNNSSMSYCVVRLMLLVTVLLVALSHVAYTQTVDQSTLRHSDVTSDGDHVMHDIWRMTRERNFCTAAEGRCYNTGQCCPGFICATDRVTHIGEMLNGDELPGVCLAAREAVSCSTSSDCGSETAECVSTGRASYCATASQTVDARERQPAAASRSGHDDEQFDEAAERDGGQWRMDMYKEHHGGLGSACDDDRQCHPFSHDGFDRLCCQDVHRGRQGTKRMCDRITQLSLCITPPRH